MMNLRHLEVFHAIMQTGSVTGAARFLNVSQPAVSSVLKLLEARQGRPLFIRIGGRLQPTPEAVAIFPDIVAIYGRLKAVNRLMQDLAGGRLGTLSVAASFPIANGYLAKAIATLVTERPETHVTLQSMTSPEVIDRVASREVELGVAFEPVNNSEVETEVLVKSGVACVMPDTHPLARLERIGVRDLADYPIITYLPHYYMRAHVDRIFNEAGIAPRISVQISISLTGMTLAYYGAGVALIEPYLLTSMPLQGLTARPLKSSIDFRTVLLRAKSAPSSVLVDMFVRHLKKTVAEMAAH
ncbi:LysR substrate-binding domain-containing protein [Pigmentiphaga soli]|uniref:LysR substrate-binding domain-containing protein n=1 Tax=Pigmentiphaga soli TaxID=1007095 RepID=A0ABP8HS84_9BURK